MRHPASVISNLHCVTKQYQAPEHLMFSHLMPNTKIRTVSRKRGYQYIKTGRLQIV